MSPPRTRSKANPSSQDAAGAKHQTEHQDPEPKRAKTDKQATKEDSSKQAERDAGEDPKEPKPGKDTNDSKDDKADQAQANGKGKGSSNGDAVRPGEETDLPSNVLEKGMIYFFIRGRINIDTPGEVDDIARSYFILRPISKDAKLGSGAIKDGGSRARTLVLPKKVFPTSGKNRVMAFVDNGGKSYKQLREDFLPADDYETKTAGTRHVPAATPVGEGVYAITSTSRESHIAYMLTLPEKLGEAQKELGLLEKGSFIVSTKNPQYPGPANARLPNPPEFSKEILEEFRTLRWMPSKPEHLDYNNAQLLLVGESSGVDKAVEPRKEDQKQDKETPAEVLEHLEEEDVARMKGLPGDASAAIFADLAADAKEFPGLLTEL